VLLNGFWIGGLAAGHWLFPGDARSQIWLVCGALLAGGVAELLVLLPESFALLGKPRLVSGLRDPDVRRIATLGLPVLFGLGVLQASILLNRIVAEVLVPGHGAVSALYYGNRLMQFPLGIIGVAVSTAAFPVLSKLAARGDLPKMNRAMGSALRGAFFLSLPAGVGLAVLAVPIVQLLLGHGAFRTDPEAGFRTGRVLALYALGVPACCLVPVAARAFYALKDMKTPTRIALASMVVNLAVGIALVWPLEEAGLALGTSASATFNLGALLWVLRRRVGFRVGAEFLLPGLKGAVSTAAMTAACVAVWKFLPILKGDSLSPQFARLAVAIGMSVAIFFLASMALNDANLKVLRRRGEPAAA
jgi:putative peptidoglycan lipid II flippase